MLYLIDAMAIAFMAAIWSKTGGPNILLAFLFTALAVINAVGSYPFVSQLVKF